MLVYAVQLYTFVKQPNLKLKTRPKQIKGSLPLAFVLLRKIFMVVVVNTSLPQRAWPILKGTNIEKSVQNLVMIKFFKFLMLYKLRMMMALY
jgi:hypothetical protein